MRLFITLSILIFFSLNANSQGCCSGGGGSPIAGGVSQGVLPVKNLEFSISNQYIRSEKFYTGDRDTNVDYLFNSNYLYYKVSYGITEALTLSLEGGYYVNKQLDDIKANTYSSSSGISDLIIFPRYQIYRKATDSVVTEITGGLGMKIPLGAYADSFVVYTDAQGVNSYTTSPPTVQATTGSNDFIFYGFFLRAYPQTKIKFFANALYVRKGWNPLGQNFGDYASFGISMSKSFRRKFGAAIQLKGEWIGMMETDPLVDMVAFYNVDVASTGGRKISIAPQINYTYKNLSLFALTEIPLYQYMNGTQLGAQYQVIFGVLYRVCLD